MAQTAATFFTTVTSSDISGGTPWNNPQNAAQEALTANCPLGVGLSTSEYLYGVDPDFAAAIPSSATIDGILVEVRGTVVSGASSVSFVDVRLTKTGADNAGENKATGSLTGTTSTRAFGGASDLWDTTWTPAEINASTFGLRVRVRNIDTGNTATVAVVWLKITIYYTPTDVSVSGAFTGGGGTFSGDVDTRRDVSGAFTGGGGTFSGTIGEPGVIGFFTGGGGTFSGDVEVLVQATGAFTGGGGTFSGSVSQPGITPGRPENLKAVRSTDFLTVTLSWDAVDDAIGYVVQQADARRAPFAEVATPSTNSQVIGSLDETTSHNWRVRAISTTGHPGPHSLAAFTKGKNTTL